MSLEHLFIQTLHTRLWVEAEAHQDPHNILDHALPWVEYVLEILISAYKGFDHLQNEKNLNVVSTHEKKAERPFQILKDIIMRGWENDDFKKQFLEKPNAAFLEKGLMVPPDVNIQVHENTEHDIFIVIPQKPPLNETYIYPSSNI